MEVKKYQLSDDALKYLQQQGQAASARGARANAAVESSRGNTAEAAKWTAMADEIDQRTGYATDAKSDAIRNRRYVVTGNEALDARNELRLRAGLDPVYTNVLDQRNQARLDAGLGISRDITPQLITINDTNKAYTNYLDDLDKQEKQLQYQITKLKRKEQTAAEDTGDPDVVYDATHNDTIRTLSNQLDRIRAQKSFTTENQTVFNVSVKGDSKLFDEYRDLHYQEQGNRLASWASAFAGSDGSNNAARNAQTQQRLNELRVELKKKGYTDEDIQAYINVANTKENQEYVQAAQEWANKNILTQNLATAGSILTAPIRGAMGAIGIAMDFGTKNSPYSYLSNVAHGVQETVGEDIKNDIVKTVTKFLPESKASDKAANYIGTAGRWVYQAAVSSLESALNMGIGGQLGEVLMGLDAATSTYNEALNNGLSADKALGSALAAGAFETIFEHMSMENLRGFKKAAESKNILRRMASLMFTEGSEEFFTDIANELYDYMANGGLSAYERFKEEYLAQNKNATERDAQKAYAIQFSKQLGQSFIVGALSGGMHGGVMSAGMGVQNAVNDVYTGKNVQALGGKTEGGVQEALSPLVNAVGAESDIGKKIAGISDKTGNRRTGKAVRQAYEQVTETQKKLMDEALAEDGMADKEARAALVDAYSDMMIGGNITRNTLSVLEEHADRLGVLDEVTSTEDMQALIELRRNIDTARVKVKKVKAQANETPELTETQKTVREQETRNIAKNAENAVTEHKTEDLVKFGYEARNEAGRRVTTGAVAGIEDGKLQVVVDRDTGATASIDTLTFDAEDAGDYVMHKIQDMMNGAGDYSVKLTKDGANMILALLENTDVDAETALSDMYNAYSKGAVLGSMDTYKMEAGYDISNEAIDAMYTAGAANYAVKPGVTRVGSEKLTDAQVKELAVIDAYAQAKGLNIVVTDQLYGDVHNGENSRIDAVRMLGRQQGDVIVVALNSGSRENVLSLTAFHETFHWLGKQGKLGERYQKTLIDNIIGYLKNSEDYDYEGIRQQRLDLGYSKDKVDEEIAAQYFGTILAEKEFQKYAAEQDAPLWKRIIDHVKAFIEDIRNRIEQRFGSDRAVQAALMSDVEFIERQVKAFDIMLDAVLEERAKGSTETEAGTDYSFAGIESKTANSADLDQEYMDAVEAGDEAKQQELVEQAAEEAMPESRIRTGNGKLRTVYHGTNSDTFTVFDRSLIGSAREDDVGFFGRGFYFAFEKGEASIYGKNVISAYLNIKNPFVFENELRRYDGERAHTTDAMTAMFIVNFADKFPELADKHKVTVTERGSYDVKELSLKEFADVFKKVYNENEFRVEETQEDYGKGWIVLGDKVTDSYTDAEGKTHAFEYYDFQQKFFSEKSARSKVEQTYAYINKMLYTYIRMPLKRTIIQETAFTDALISRGYDGVLQSEKGDEIVAFYPEQIKSADPVTYDDAGNVIPLSERFNSEKEDIRWSVDVDQERRGNGYDGYSMSNNARAAYQAGEKPISKWTKAEIIDAVSEIDEDKANMLTGVPLRTLKDKLLYKSSWHHTSGMYNRTDFYAVDEDVLENLTQNTVNEWMEIPAAPKPESNAYRGAIDYIEWEGTRKHPKAVKQHLDNVNIEERGSFYIVTDDTGKEILRKKIGSNGTFVTNYDEQERRKQKQAEDTQRYRENSSEAAYAFYQTLRRNGMDVSTSGNMYERGRKPSRRDYENGLENFHTVGEHRLYNDTVNKKYLLETWDGSEWVRETDADYSVDVDSAAEELTERIRMQDERAAETLDVMRDYVEKTNGVADKRLNRKVYAKLADKYLLTREGNEGKLKRAQVDEFVKKLERIDGLITTAENVDSAIFYELYKMMREDVESAGQYETMDWVREYRSYFRENGKNITIKIPQDVITDVVENYGGRQGFRKEVIGMFNVSYDENKGQDLDEFYEELGNKGFNLPTEQANGQAVTASDKVRNLIDMYRADDKIYHKTTADVKADAEYEGRSLEEMSADKAFSLMTEILLQGREMTRNAQQDAAYLKELRAQAGEENKEIQRQIQERMTQAYNNEMIRLRTQNLDSVQYEIEAEKIRLRYQLEGVKENYDRALAAIEEENAVLNAQRDEGVRQLRAEYEAKFERQKEQNAEQNKRMEQELRARYKEGNEKRKELQREWYKEQLKNNRQEYNDRTKVLRQMYEERLTKQRRKQEDTMQRMAEIRKAKRQMKAITDVFLNDKKNKYLPLELQKDILAFAQTFEGDRNMLTSNAMERLNHVANVMLGRSSENVSVAYENMFGQFDDKVAETLQNMIETVKEAEQKYKRRRNLTGLMTLKQLKDLNDVMTHVRFIIESANSIYINGRRQQMNTVCDNFKTECDDQKKHNARALNSKLYDATLVKMLTPIYLFDERIGGEFAKMYEDLRNGQDEWMWHVKDAYTQLRKIQNDYKYDTWKDKEIQLHYEATGMRTAWDPKITIEAAMQIYATAKRQVLNGMESEHLNKGGIIISDDATVKKTYRQWAKEIKQDEKAGKLTAEEREESWAEYVNRQETAGRHQLTVGEMMQIEDILKKEAPQAIEYVNACVEFLSNTCSGWGNETSLQLTGLKKFNEKYYFPYRSASDYLHQRFGAGDDARLKNIGFTKSLQQGASTPLMITGFTQVFAEHSEQMARYAAFALRLDNFARVLNYQPMIETEDGLEPTQNNIRTMIKNTYGAPVMNYISEFLTQMNGGPRADTIDSLINKFTGTFKRAAVLGNLSVVIQQPTAMMRAMAMINPVYFTSFSPGELTRIKNDGVSLKALYRDYKDMMDHSAIANVKQMGGFDTDTGRSAVGWIMDEQKFLEKCSSYLGKGAEIADIVTWTNIWNAVKRETIHKQRDVEYGSDEFYRIVNERFRDIIDYTQVYDSTMSKNAWMRSPAGLARMVTAFMAEPSLSFNLITQSGLKGNGKAINAPRAIAAFIANIAVNAAFKAIVGAWRDKAEDETYAEKWIRRFTDDFFGNWKVSVKGKEVPLFFLNGSWSPLTMIPYVKDILSLMEGFNVDRSDVSVISDIWDAGLEFVDSIKAEDGTLQLPDFVETVKFASVLSEISPLPMQRIVQDIKGLEKLIFEDHSWMTTTKATAWRAFNEGLGFELGDAEKAYNAVMNNDQETLKRLLHASDEKLEKIEGKGYTGEKIQKEADVEMEKKYISLLAEGLAAFDPEQRVQAAAQARADRNYDLYDELVEDMVNDGFNRNAVLTATETAWKALNAEEPEVQEIKDRTAYSYTDMKAAVDANDLKGFEHVMTELKKQGKVESDIREEAREYIGKQLGKGAYDEQTAVVLYQRFGGLNEEAARKKAGYNSYKGSNENTAMYDSAWDSYTRITKNATMTPQEAGIDPEDYANYYKAKNAVKGKDEDGDGETDKNSVKKQILPLIDALPISDEAKDQLYLMEWAEYDRGKNGISLKDAPWHKP